MTDLKALRSFVAIIDEGSFAAAARRMGISKSMCSKMIADLEADLGTRLLTRTTRAVTPTAAGLGFHAIVHVTLARHDRSAVQRVMTELTIRPEVVECYATTGQYDYHLRVLCADMAAYRRFLDDFLFRLPAIESAQTNVVLEDLKRRSMVPV